MSRRLTVGDRVVYYNSLEPNEFNGRHGKIVIDNERVIPYNIQFDDTTRAWARSSNVHSESTWHDPDSSSKVTTTEPSTMTWQFRINRVSDVDYDKIHEDLSWDNPLAVVDYNNGQKIQVVVLRDLVMKAVDTYIGQPCGLLHEAKSGNNIYYFALSSYTDIKKLQDWAKEVRQSPWPDVYKANVKVSLLKV